jgi:putative membrane protein
MMDDYSGMADMPGWMVAFMGVAGVVWLLVGIAVVVLIVVAAIWLASRLRRDVATGGRTSNAIDELDHRYARGELDRDCYLQMRKDIVGR